MTNKDTNSAASIEQLITDKERSGAPIGLPITGGDKSSPYSKVLQGKPIHGLISSSASHGNIQLNAVTHEGTMSSEGVLITIDEEAIQDISAQTFKVLILLLTVATIQLPHETAITAEAINKGRNVKIPLAKYMEACKIKDLKEARTQLNEAIKALYAVSLEWDETVYEKPEGGSRKVRITKHHRMRITDHTITQEEGNPVKRGVAEIRLSFDMAEYLSGAYIMFYPDALLSINTRYHPYSIPLGWKLCSLHNSNFGKKTANITTVKTLLNAAKGIPRYSDISQQGHIYERIISRLDRDLAALVEAGVLSTYWYFTEESALGTIIEGGKYKDGKYIESNQLGLLSYTEFSALYVHYEIKNYPDQTPRLEAKSKRIKAAISRRKNAAKKSEERTGDGAQ